MPQFAVIDCGTNTFHILIAEPAEGGGFREIYRERKFIKLAADGIQRIGSAPYERALQTLIHYAEVIDAHQVHAVRVSGTAALRTASNGPDFVREVAEKTGLRIDVIPGDQEARLIHLGVKAAILPQQAPWMVMDIGGGSVEFIIANKDGVQWYQSFPVGVAVMYKQYHLSEPISTTEKEATRNFLRRELAPLIEALRHHPVQHLVGAAGTFDVIADVLGQDHPTPHSATIDLGGFHQLYHRILDADQEQRHAMPEVPSDRADMIVVALILVDFILDLAGIRQLTVSSFSMKEGMLAEMLEQYEAEVVNGEK